MVTWKQIMVLASRALVLASITAVLGSATIVAQRGGAPTQMTDAQKKNLQAIISLADDASAGKPSPNDLALTWVHDDMLRTAQEGQTFVPFVVTVDPAKVTGNTVSVYWRVVDKSAPAPVAPPADAKKNDKDKDKNAPPPQKYTYEAINTAPVVPGEPLRISRSFRSTAGSYDVYVVVKEEPPTDKKPDKNAPPLKASVIKQAVTIPDLWNGQLNTSSVIVAEKLNQLSTPLSSQEMISRPYALGAVEIVPYTRTKFAKKEVLNSLILIYNAMKDAGGKPDLKVEFNFHAKQAGGEKFFISSLPTNLNGQTLSAADLASGQWQVGQAIPLESFPEGDYRMEIIVTDNLAKKDVKRDVNFSVTGS